MKKCELTLYNMKFSHDHMFFRGIQDLYGKIDNTLFLCCAKSGSQSLWLPFQPSTGIKIFHPKGQSNSEEKVNRAYEVQKILAEYEVAPKPHELYEVSLNLEFLNDDWKEEWSCYGVYMDRVKCRISTAQKFLADLNVPLSKEFIPRVLMYRDFDALSLAEIVLIARFHGVNIYRKIKDLVSEFAFKITEYKTATNSESLTEPTVEIDVYAMDLLTWTNILLGDEGLRVIDFDLC